MYFGESQCPGSYAEWHSSKQIVVTYEELVEYQKGFWGAQELLGAHLEKHWSRSLSFPRDAHVTLKFQSYADLPGCVSPIEYKMINGLGHLPYKERL